jgi:hypothetical protein
VSAPGIELFVDTSVWSLALLADAADCVYDFVWPCHDAIEIGPRMLARNTEATGLTTEDLKGPAEV